MSFGALANSTLSHEAIQIQSVPKGIAVNLRTY